MCVSAVDCHPTTCCYVLLAGNNAAVAEHGMNMCIHMLLLPADANCSHAVVSPARVRPQATTLCCCCLRQEHQRCCRQALLPPAVLLLLLLLLPVLPPATAARLLCVCSLLPPCPQVSPAGRGGGRAAAHLGAQRAPCGPDQPHSTHQSRSSTDSSSSSTHQRDARTDAFSCVRV